MKPIELFGTGIAGKSFNVTRQRRVNCYIENRPDGDKTKIAIYGTPGLGGGYFSLPGVVRGMLGTQTHLYAVCGTILFQSTSITGGGGYAQGILTNHGYVSMAVNPTQLLIVDGTYGYISMLSSGTSSGVAQITSSGFPNGAQTCTYVGGYFVVEQPGTPYFWVSNVLDGTTWNALAFAGATQYADNIKAVDALNGNLVLFSERHMEFWQNVGTTPEPFAPILAASNEYGLSSVFSRAHIDSSIIFLAENPQGTAQIVQLKGYQASVISTPDLEYLISTFPASDQSGATALSYVTDGHPMYQITFPNANTGYGRSFLYDCSTGVWSETQTGVGGEFGQRHIGQFSANFGGTALISDYANAAIYTQSSAYYTDVGSPILREVDTRHINFGFNVASIYELYLDMETGVGTTNPVLNPQVMIQCSKDNGHTWGTERWFSLGNLGNYTTRLVTRLWGQGRDFVFRIRMTDPVKFAITGAAITSTSRPQ